MPAVRYCGRAVITVRLEPDEPAGHRLYQVSVRVPGLASFDHALPMPREPGDPMDPDTVDRIAGLVLGICVLDRPDYALATEWGTTRANLGRAIVRRVR